MWTERLTPDELGDLLTRVVSTLWGRKVESLTPADLPSSGALAKAALRWSWALERDLGFVIVRGIDVDALSPERLTLSFVVIGLHLGVPVPQNFRGELITWLQAPGFDDGDAQLRVGITRELSRWARR